MLAVASRRVVEFVERVFIRAFTNTNTQKKNVAIIYFHFLRCALLLFLLRFSSFSSFPFLFIELFM